MGENLPVRTLAAAAGVDRHDDALGPELACQSIDQLGRGHRRGVHRNLVGPCSKQRPAVRDRADAATDCQRDEDLLRRPFHDVQHGGAIVRRGGDVEQHELVGTLGVVSGGQLHGVAGVTESPELDTLDDPPAIDVEAGDDPHCSHAATASEIESAPDNNARPTIAPASRWAGLSRAPRARHEVRGAPDTA